MIVDHGLERCAVFGAAQEKSAIGTKVIPHFQPDFEIPVVLIGKEDASVAWDVLGSDDHAIGDDPFATCLVFAGLAMTRLRADMPALE